MMMYNKGFIPMEVFEYTPYGFILSIVYVLIFSVVFYLVLSFKLPKYKLTKRRVK